jgi:hypothetical protein
VVYFKIVLSIFLERLREITGYLSQDNLFTFRDVKEVVLSSEHKLDLPLRHPDLSPGYKFLTLFNDLILSATGYRASNRTTTVKGSSLVYYELLPQHLS